MWPSQVCVDTQLWNWEFCLGLFGSKPFLFSVGILQIRHLEEIYSSLMDTKHLTNMRWYRTQYFGTPPFQAYQKSFLDGIHLVLSLPSLAFIPFAKCTFPVSSSLASCHWLFSPFPCLPPHPTVSNFVSLPHNTLYAVDICRWVDDVISRLVISALES